MRTETDQSFADSPGGERGTNGGVEEGSGGWSWQLMRQEAEAGTRVHQEVLRRDGVPKKDELTASKLILKWAVLEHQPGAGRSAVAGVDTKQLVIITNIRWWSLRHQVARQTRRRVVLLRAAAKRVAA